MVREYKRCPYCKTELRKVISAYPLTNIYKCENINCESHKVSLGYFIEMDKYKYKEVLDFNEITKYEYLENNISFGLSNLYGFRNKKKL